MKHKLSTLLALVVLTMALAASTARAQTVAPGPYYAPPSWDQALPAATRFIVLSNMNSDAVLDRETGLVWERSPSADTNSFQNADAFLCNFKNTGGRLGWRMPSVWELLSLVDRTQSSPTLPAGHPFNVSGSLTFWTNTPYSVGFGALSAWVVSFGFGGSGTQGVNNFVRAWCVRGVGGVAPVNPNSP